MTDSDPNIATSVVPPFVDTHVHFYDLDDPHDLRWTWLDLDQPDGLSLDLARMGQRRFTPHELLSEGARFARLSKVVHVQAALGSRDPVSETIWLQSLRERFGSPHAAIAYVELDRPNAKEVVERHRMYDFVRGVRQMGVKQDLNHPRYIENVRYLGQLGLLYEVYCRPRRFESLAELALKSSNTKIVLEHFGGPPTPASDEFDAWRCELRKVARSENIYLKLSGLALMSPTWSVADATILVNESLEAFGASRCVVGTNFPVDRPSCSYTDAVFAISEASRSLSRTEREDLFSRNAEALYSI